MKPNEISLIVLFFLVMIFSIWSPNWKVLWGSLMDTAKRLRPGIGAMTGGLVKPYNPIDNRKHKKNK